MKHRVLFPSLILLLGLTAPLARAQSPEEKKPPVAAHFVQPEAVDWKALLPGPPAPGSIAALGDLETVLQVQARRTPAEIAWAKWVEQDKVFADYAGVLGPWFDEKNLPVLADFLSQVTTDSWLTGGRMKNLYPRQRPPAVDAAVQPVVRIPPFQFLPERPLAARICVGRGAGGCFSRTAGGAFCPSPVGGVGPGDRRGAFSD